MKSLCVFCGSATGDRPAYAAAARRMGATLAAAGLRIVYGGGSVGLMGVLADAALAAGGAVVGVIPRTLWEREVGHAGLTELHVVETMHQRKALMADLSDGFVALPGGVGTLEELFEIWTWALLGVHAKPCGILNVDGYFDPLLAFVDQVVARGFLRPEYRAMIRVEREPEPLLARLAEYRAPAVAKWVRPSQT